jgi:hypothetical protein
MKIFDAYAPYDIIATASNAVLCSDLKGNDVMNTTDTALYTRKLKNFTDYLQSELKERWTKLGDEMQFNIVEEFVYQLDGAFGALKKICGAYNDAEAFIINSRLTLSAFLTLELLDAEKRAEELDVQAIRRARDLVDKSEFCDYQWQRIGFAVSVLRSVLQTKKNYEKKTKERVFPFAKSYVGFAFSALEAELGKSVFFGEKKWAFAKYVTRLVHNKALSQS